MSIEKLNRMKYIILNCEEQKQKLVLQDKTEISYIKFDVILNACFAHVRKWTPLHFWVYEISKSRKLVLIYSHYWKFHQVDCGIRIEFIAKIFPKPIARIEECHWYKLGQRWWGKLQLVAISNRVLLELSILTYGLGETNLWVDR